VLETCDGLDLALEALGTKRVGRFRVEYLERHRALVPEIVNQKHRGHTTPTQLAVESVTVTQAALEQLPEVCH
jgi:hypothetical protein